MPARPALAEVAGGILLLRLDEAIYSREAVLRTCYWFTDRAYLYVTRTAPGILEVQVKVKSDTPSLTEPSPPKIEDLAGDFLNHLLDHQLRHEIEERTGAIRELLVAKAFDEAGELEDAPPGNPNDPVADSQVPRH